MTEQQSVLVHRADGVSGRIIATDANNAVHVRFDDGIEVLLAANLLHAQPDGSQRVDLSAADIAKLQPGVARVVPVIEETATVQPHTVTTGGVRVVLAAHSEESTISTPLTTEQVHVERVPVQRFVGDAHPPEPRYEGATLIVPIVEERVVVQKQWFVVEEVRVTKTVDEHVHEEKVTLQRQQVTLEPLDAADEKP